MMAGAVLSGVGYRIRRVFYKGLEKYRQIRGKLIYYLQITMGFINFFVTRPIQSQAVTTIQ